MQVKFHCVGEVFIGSAARVRNNLSKVANSKDSCLFNGIMKGLS